MLKQTNESVYQALVKRRNISILSADLQQQILAASQVVRGVDYVSSWETSGANTAAAKTVVTRANWRFILTGISIYSQFVPEAAGAFPDFIFKFKNLPFSKSFANVTDPNLLDTVWSKLVIGCQDNGVHFEEFGNECFLLPERAVIETIVKPHIMWGGSYYPHNRGTILYTGIEVKMGD